MHFCATAATTLFASSRQSTSRYPLIDILADILSNCMISAFLPGKAKADKSCFAIIFYLVLSVLLILVRLESIRPAVAKIEWPLIDT